jgi:hypothetical protein
MRYSGEYEHWHDLDKDAVHYDKIMILDYQQNINKPHDVNFHKTALTGWYL